jgi:hypothetical protein
MSGGHDRRDLIFRHDLRQHYLPGRTLAGGGARLFDDGPAGSSWSLTDMKATSSGGICLFCDRLADSPCRVCQGGQVGPGRHRVP